MTCKYCGSNDVINIQGQDYCINCGQILGKNAPTPKEAKKPTKKAPATTLVKSAVEKTAPAKVEVVNKKAVSPKITVTKEIASPPALKKVETKRRRSTVKALPIQQSVQKKESPNSSKPITPKTNPRVINRPRRGRKIETVDITIKPKSETPPPPARVLNLKEQPPVQPEDINPHPTTFVIRTALIAAVPAGIAAGLAAWLKLDRNTVVIAASAAAVAIGLLVSFAQAALLYGMSRSQDGRPVSKKQWWSAAANGFMDMVNVDLATLISGLLIVAVAGAAWRGLQLLPIQPNGLSVGLGILVNGALAWLLLGAFAARHIAIPAVIVGGMSSWNALKYGWRTYLKAGGHLVLALIEGLIVRLALILGLGTAGMVTMQYVLGDDRLVASFASAGSVMVIVFSACVLVLQIETRVWLRLYRYWVSLYFPKQRLELLSGRTRVPIGR